MKQWLQGFAMLLVVMSTAACAEEPAATFQAGVDYALITPAQPTDDPSKIEVVEVFWYGCPHCFKLEPVLAPWVAKLPEDVRFVRMPAVFSLKWEAHAKAYFTSEILEVTEKTHEPLFNAIHLGNQLINTQASLADFFADFGVDKTLFDKTYNSFVVRTQLSRAQDQVKRYGITGVPALVINGKYLVTGRMAKSYDNMLKIMDFLIDQERHSGA